MREETTADTSARPRLASPASNMGLPDVMQPHYYRMNHWLSTWVDQSLAVTQLGLQTLLPDFGRLSTNSVSKTSARGKSSSRTTLLGKAEEIKPSGANAPTGMSPMQPPLLAEASKNDLCSRLAQVSEFEELWATLLDTFSGKREGLRLMLTRINWSTASIEPLRLYPSHNANLSTPFSAQPYRVSLDYSEHPWVQASTKEDTSYSPIDLWSQDIWVSDWLKTTAMSASTPAPCGFFTIPLIAGKKLIGMLSLGYPQLDGRAQSCISELYASREMLAHTLWNLQLQSALPKASQDISLIDPVLRPLLTALELKDPYTYQHSQKVALYAEELACYIGLDPHETQQLRLAALLHDVGKLAVSDNILKKEGKLTAEEWELMRQHPQWGANRLLGGIDSLRPILPWIRYHHERWDGGGYPQGLIGSHIPFGARLIAVVDAFHAMTSDRPYRKAMETTQAVDILTKEAGRQFDPFVVDAFLQSFKSTYADSSSLLSA